MRFRDIVAALPTFLVAAVAGYLIFVAVDLVAGPSPEPAPTDPTASIDRLTATLQDTITVRVVFRYVPIDPDEVEAQPCAR